MSVLHVHGFVSENKKAKHISVHELSYEYCNLMTLKGNPPNFTHESLRVL